MKKIFIAMAAIFTMLLSVASPIMVKPIKASAAYVAYNNINSPAEDICQDYLGTASQPYWHPSTDNSVSLDSNSKVLYLAAKQSRNGSPCDTLGLMLNFSNADYTFENGVITLDNVIRSNENTGGYKIVTYYWGRSAIDYWSNNTFKSAVIDLNNKSVILYANNGFTGNHQDEWYIQGNNTVITDFIDIESNITDLVPPSLNLSVTVDGAYGFGGVITRKQTDPNTGITSTADNLHFTVKNNGADAQWLFAIVPTGQSLDFEGWVWTGRENIIGNPTYCYASDEWITLGLEGINIFDSSSSANAVYCPSVWHPSAAGAQTGYSVAYESMNLTANQSYQIVVYGCLNPNLEEMTGFYAYNDGLGTTPNQLTSTYTVHGNIGEYEEVYRSLSFTMTDPAIFNPNYTNSRDSSYAWDSNSDMKELFQNGSAYRDEDGNVRIKGFQIGSSTYSWENNQTGGSGSSYTSGSKNLNTQQAFGGFFNLFNWFLTAIPKDYQLVIFFGVVAIVIIAIIKAVK